MSQPLPSTLYHISKTKGIAVFRPRRCWFNPARTGSGMLPEGANPPDGCSIISCVFAGEAQFVRRFCLPSHKKRFSLRRPFPSTVLAGIALGVACERHHEALLLEERDREEIRALRMHLYEFDPAPFVQYPSGEYVAMQDVVPRRERELQDPLTEMDTHGIAVVFVPDIEQSFAASLTAGAALGVVANIEGSRKLFAL